MVNLREEQIEELCDEAQKIFISQPMLLELEPPIKIVGNIHGQYFDLLRIFEFAGGFPPDQNYLFLGLLEFEHLLRFLTVFMCLGDYVDHGKHQLETICLLFAFKIKYPDTFFLLRGHHECGAINGTVFFGDRARKIALESILKKLTQIESMVFSTNANAVISLEYGKNFWKSLIVCLLLLLLLIKYFACRFRIILF